MKIIVIGNGGHSRVIQDIIAARGTEQLTAILDDKYTFGFIENDIYFGPIADINHMVSEEIRIVVAIGNNRTRKRVVQLIGDEHFATLIHPSAIISPSAFIGRGTVVMPYAVVNAAASVGEHCIINTASIVEHDNQVGNFTHLCPNVTLTGQVSIGEGVVMGAASTVIPGVTIEDWSVVGAGSTVIRDVPTSSKIAGSPARSIKKAMPIEFLHRAGGEPFVKAKNIPLSTAHDRK
ncbi:acetyltransferase [Halobacillus sp. B23F22_1]|uniref:acetyltransferase n=1 Tax=Halobacillus sp. B23F22_1 TaxID=3459514 RepID=UPI00373F8E02